jgi:hypothetical protein
MLFEGTRKIVENVAIHHARGITIRDFYDMEVMGVVCSPKCGSCKCGKCPLGGKNYTLKEEHELKLIEEGLSHIENHWVAQYPWIRNPIELPNNYKAVFAKLSTHLGHVPRNLQKDS